MKSAEDVRLPYDEVVRKSKKALLIKFTGEEYPSPVWVPKYKAVVDEEDGTVFMARDFSETVLLKARKPVNSSVKDQEDHGNEVVMLRPNPFDWERGKMFGINISLYRKSTEELAGRGMAFFPKSLYQDGGVPRWIVNKKVAEFITEKEPSIIDEVSNGIEFALEGLLMSGMFIVDAGVVKELRKLMTRSQTNPYI